MTSDEIRKMGDDIAVAIRARGQFIADQAKAQGMGEGADLIVKCFGQAADVATIRTINMQMQQMGRERDARQKSGVST